MTSSVLPAQNLTNRLRSQFSSGGSMPQSVTGLHAAIFDPSQPLAESGLTPDQNLALFSDAIDEVSQELGASVAAATQPTLDQVADNTDSVPQGLTGTAQPLTKEVLRSIPFEVTTDAQSGVLAPETQSDADAANQVEVAAPQLESPAEVTQNQEAQLELSPEVSPEISPEVAEYLKHVEDHDVAAPETVVMPDVAIAPTHVPRPVIVLPIDESVERSATFKSPVNSVRWLVEWSRKIMKMFAGQVVYKF